MHPFSRRSNSIVLLILAIALASCQKPPENYPVRKAAPGTAQLPPRPDLNPPKPPDRYPDGAFSVAGLFAQDPQKLVTELLVRGTIAALQVCPVSEKICRPAPYLHLTDAKNGQGKRLLVGGERDLGARGWKVGDEVTVTGTFATSSPDGIYFAPNGMVLLTPLPDSDATAGAAQPDAK